jgi:crossover junction endodeoxyribonuclease RuvC
MPTRILLGLDPGFADLGFGVIEVGGGKDRCLTYGSIKTPAGLPMEERLCQVHAELVKLIAAWRPEAAAIERLFFSSNAKTAMDVAEARGVIRLCLAQHHLPCREFGPGEIKLAVTGDGRAAKPEMQKMVMMLLGLKEVPKPDDAADALAIALAAAHTRL